MSRRQSCGPARPARWRPRSWLCAAHGVAVVPQGGNTGLVGGGVPLAGEVVLSLRPARRGRRRRHHRRPAHRGRRRRRSPRPAGGRRRGLGLRRRLRRPATAATIGGTDRHQRRRPAGPAVRRHAGPARSASRRCSATARSSRHLGGLLKDNTGYHLPSLLCGSEGTLGIVTAARLRLVPGRRAGRRAAGLRRRRGRLWPPWRAAPALAELEAAELFLADGPRPGVPAPACRRRSPRRTPRYLLVEAAAAERPERRAGRGRRGAPRASPTSRWPPTPARRAAAVALPRGAHGGDQHAGPAAQVRRHPAAGRAGRVRRRRCRREVARSRPAPGRGCSATSATATSTSTSPASDPDDDDRSTTPCSRLVAGLGGSISAEHGIGTGKRPLAAPQPQPGRDRRLPRR